MAEGTYEYECMRAELLGIEKPNYEDFLKKQQKYDEEQQEVEDLKEVDYECEQMGHISGGLDELNSILQVTQRKINRFKASCSSFTNLLKFKLGSASEDVVPVENTINTQMQISNENNTVEESSRKSDTLGESPRKSDLAKALDNHVDRLETMIEKAENAQYSMSHQNKEMKRFLQ